MGQGQTSFKQMFENAQRWVVSEMTNQSTLAVLSLSCVVGHAQYKVILSELCAALAAFMDGKQCHNEQARDRGWAIQII